tara:strand:- start:679 stop:951 length:273 start_codon:yes stop_codon:yes gene_type:complete
MTTNEIKDTALLSELNLSASELLYSAFLFHLNCNPMSTAPFIDDLVRAFEWVEEPQRVRIKEVIESAISSDHLTDNQFIIWECALSNLTQ